MGQDGAVGRLLINALLNQLLCNQRSRKQRTGFEPTCMPCCSALYWLSPSSTSTCSSSSACSASRTLAPLRYGRRDSYWRSCTLTLTPRLKQPTAPRSTCQMMRRCPCSS